jgi:integrase
MASISKQPNGHKIIQFKAADGKRRSIRLGKMSMRNAEAVKVKVEQLVAASITGHSIDDETARWLTKLDSSFSNKLARVGLMTSKESFTLKEFLDEYFKLRIDVKPATKGVWGQTRRNLIEFFGPEQSLRDITKGNAEEWRLYLIQEGLAEPTIRKRCSFAKQFFHFAVKKELIISNPFTELKSRALSNPNRFYFISRDEAEKVIDACPDNQWRLLFALSRYGGLRCPSEHLLLKWDDVDWERDRITVTSPKTEHHEGGGSRVIPIFPELKHHLEEAFEIAESGTEYVITRYRNKNSNLRTQLLRIIKRAGLNAWPKLFQNLRSTRETELAETYPMHVVCSWIGNTEAIAAKHYLQVTEDHFNRALHNPVQQSAVLPRIGSQPVNSTSENYPIIHRDSDDCQTLRNVKSGERGIRTPGTLRYAGFQDQCIRPLCHLSGCRVVLYWLWNSDRKKPNKVRFACRIQFSHA